MERLYYSISQAEQEVGIPAHTIRFWEKRLDHKPTIVGNRRRYTTEDLDWLRWVKDMLYVGGYTLDGLGTRDQTWVRVGTGATMAAWLQKQSGTLRVTVERIKT